MQLVPERLLRLSISLAIAVFTYASLDGVVRVLVHTVLLVIFVGMATHVALQLLAQWMPL